jgi:methylsterol monooxygenase
MAFTNNYSTSFRWCDWLFGTDKKYHEYRARLRAAKAAAPSSGDNKEHIMLQQELVERIEAEGLRAEAEVVGKSSNKN